MIPHNYTPKPYPAVRYHRTLPPRTVATLEADLALGPEWAKTPAAFADSAADARGTGPAVSAAGPTGGASAVESAEAAELHATKAADAVSRVQVAQSIEALERARTMEEGNPNHKGGRKSVLNAIDARLAALRSASA